MGSKVSFAKTTLSYPLFAAEFDPYNRGYLVVGGGGGESKTGVPNQISVIDVSNRAQLTTALEVPLPSSEDSVQSLASLATKDGLITFAGINSSEEQQKAGRNEHLRSFDVKYPPRKRQRTESGDSDKKEDDGSIAPLGKRSLFKRSTAAKSETYQRLLRLSPARIRDGMGSKRIGAIATGMAKDSEIVVFSATSATPQDSDIITRIDLPEGDEAADMDIVEPETSEFSLAYCTDYDLYEQTYAYDFGSKKAEKTPKGPRRVFQMPFPDESEKTKARSKFRSVRFLNAQNVVTLSNKPNKSGAELRILHLYPTGPASLLLTKSLPSRIKSAVSLDVCTLDTDKNGNQQIAIAVAGQDISIEIYVTNYQRATDTFSPFRSYLTLRDVHGHQITKLCFSAFHSPTRAPDPEPATTDSNGQIVPEKPVEKALHPGPQYIRLASVSYGNTVVVDTLPLQPLEPQDKRSRYVLSHPSDEKFTLVAYASIITMIVLVTAFLLQSFLTGFSEGSGGIFSLLPYSVREFLDAPAAAARGARYTVASKVETNIPTNLPVVKARLRDLLASHSPSSPNGEKKALVVRDSADSTELSVDVHPDREAYVKQDTAALHWEQLSREQQMRWKNRLVQAGEWVESEGEAVLKGVLFSGYAGAVGQVAAEVVGG